VLAFSRRKWDVFFSTGIKWDNSAPYCGQLPALEKIETVSCCTAFWWWCNPCYQKTWKAVDNPGVEWDLSHRCCIFIPQKLCQVIWCYKVQFSLQYLCICKPHLLSRKNTWISIMCVHCFLYYIFWCWCNLAAFLYHVWCDVMWCCLLDNVPMFWRNLCITQHEITFQQTIILIIRL